MRVNTIYFVLVLLTASPLWRPEARAQTAGPDSLTISLNGSCPGWLTVQWEGATPDRSAALMFAHATGNFRTPFEHCEGTRLGLDHDGLRLVRHFGTGPEGAGELTGRAVTLACSGYLQLVVVDQRPCTTSNVEQIPQ